MRRILLAGLVLIGVWPAAGVAQQPADTGRVQVTGVVLDSLTGAPVPAATVSFRGARRVVFTDSLGRFSLDAPRAAGEQVQARQLGYGTVSFQLDIGPETAPLLIYLTPDPVPLQAITARASKSGRYTIEGTVVDSATERPLPHAVVWFRSSHGSALTDTLGHYVYDGARAGYEDMVVDVLGYYRRTAYRAVREPWQRVDFVLRPDPAVLAGSAGLMRRLRHERISVGPSPRVHVYTEQDLARSGLGSVLEFLAYLNLVSVPRVMPALGGHIMPVVSDMSRAYDPATGAIVAGDFLESVRAVWGLADLRPSEPPPALALDGKPVLGGVENLPNFPLSHFYAIVIPTGRTGASNPRQKSPGVYLYTKGFMRLVLRSGARPPWQTPVDSLPDAWRER